MQQNGFKYEKVLKLFKVANKNQYELILNSFNFPPPLKEILTFALLTLWCIKFAFNFLGKQWIQLFNLFIFLFILYTNSPFDTNLQICYEEHCIKCAFILKTQDINILKIKDEEFNLS